MPFDYADPEDYYPQKDENILQKICEKSDVYSFGVVLLELITGRTIFDEHGVDIVNWAKPFMFKGDSVEINYSCLVDSALKGDYIKSEMELMIYCAVSVYRPSKLRPRMKQIVEALEGKMPSNELWVAEVNTGKASESRSSKAGDMSETTSSPFQELKEITEASNLHWSKATSSQGIEPEIMQIQEMHAKSHYSALEQAATLSETSLEATAHNVMPSSRLMKVYHILNEIMTRIGNPNISTIGVCGGEGVGKTTLLEALKIQPVIRDVFQFVIWVTVPKEFISLNTVGIPDPTPENGCKIVLTTRSEQVCDRISVDSKINLENLLCKLFWENVGESIYSSNLQPLARKVVDLCCYHSHAIFLMSKALKDESDVDVWNNAIETLNMQAASPEQELEHIMVNVLKFSYLRLPDDTTRRCLKNGALFFVNEKIARKSLIDNWISDDLTDTHQKGRNVLETLVTAGLLERSEDGQFFTLHEIDRCILLEYIVPTEEAQVLFLINGGMGLTKPPKVEQWEGLIEICLMDNDISELPISPSCPKLRKLFLERNYKLRIIPPSFFDNMPALQVLNLSRTSIKSLPESLFKLFNLRRLFLNHCVLITTLSSKVGELKQLEVLDLEGTEIMYLPKEVGQLTNLTCLEVSFFEPTSQRRLEQSGEIIPCGAISALSQLEELNIDMSYDDKRWNASAEAVVSEICKLKSLHTLKVYFPKVKLLSHLQWNEENMAFPSLSYFKFTVGHLVERIISRVSCDTELELERHDRAMQRTSSNYGGDQIESSSSDATVGLVSLEYMHIYYMKNLRSIWEGPVNDSSFNSLKCLTLRTCPELTTVFTPRLLTNFSNLEELTIRDCPKITTLVSCDSCDHNITSILPALKRISLHFLPKLTSISSGLLMAPMLELMSFQYCLNLKSLPISKASNKNLRKIKGEESWWQELKWEGTHHDSWADIFVPID
ncbi:hypothetical protein GH714_024923 [Hevea brasiliensis]|uniref:Uncharacterized protein n=1 Tax=Hevea brasiliensis TaxID=3981 RepID=A0A6A6N3C1_HEVBR|nr:hypothetical protein GH714_024923 [Hevea brasiliensis]